MQLHFVGTVMKKKDLNNLIKTVLHLPSNVSCTYIPTYVLVTRLLHKMPIIIIVNCLVMHFVKKLNVLNGRISILRPFGITNMYLVSDFLIFIV
jgi:hypothetical protein